MKEDKVVFVDRDGVINEDRIGDYIKTWEEFRFHRGVVAGLKRLTGAGFKIILISNQAGVGDGVYSEAQLKKVHEKMLEAFSAAGGPASGGREVGIKIHRSYYCLHGKNEGCDCRKPKVGLFLQAEQNGLRIAKSKTYFIGDKVTDIEAGKNYGLRTILVRTGYGRQDEKLCKGRLKPDWVVDKFEEAVSRVLCE